MFLSAYFSSRLTEGDEEQGVRGKTCERGVNCVSVCSVGGAPLKKTLIPISREANSDVTQWALAL